jgi:hypothetical protein
MTKHLTDSSNVILGVIRGEMPLTALAAVGIDVHCENASCRLTSAKLPEVVAPSVFDVVSGLLANRGNPEELRLWAFFVLAESGVDLRKLESHAEGELLLNALWDASTGGSISENIIHLAERLEKHSE